MKKQTETDLKAEFIASTWLDTGASPEAFVLRSLGAFRRRSHQDVGKVREMEIGRYEGLVIEANRSGIYDHLPEQLFHLPTSPNIGSLKKKVEEIRLQREKEQKTRLFFLPLEQEFFLARALTEQMEQRAMELRSGTSFLEELRAFWQVPGAIGDHILISLLPVLAGISGRRGDILFAEKTLSELTGQPVKISETASPQAEIPSDARLAEMHLGMDTILGGQIDHYLPELKIEIEFVDPGGLESYFRDPFMRLLIEWMMGWFLPAEYLFHIVPTISDREAGLHLEGKNKHSSRLGFSVLAV